MSWTKRGFIFKPSGALPWSTSHAQVPVVDFLEDRNVLKVYFSTRDAQSRSLPGWVELDADNPKRVLAVGAEPILGLGDLGTFDDCGVMPSWIVNSDGKKYLYYIGWNVRNTIAYHNSIGLAISDDGGERFHRFSKGPLWDRDHIEPHYSGTSCVLVEDGVWKNWYLSCTEWRMVNGKSEPRYHIKYAESKDGINWLRNGQIAIDYLDDLEGGIVKASVVKDAGIYKMWYSFRRLVDYRGDRNESYRIGYAESHDGVSWERKDDVSGIDVDENPNAWDGMMNEYPHVIDVKGKRYMFYNGNGFGASGFGYAEWLA